MMVTGRRQQRRQQRARTEVQSATDMRGIPAAGKSVTRMNTGVGNRSSVAHACGKNAKSNKGSEPLQATDRICGVNIGAKAQKCT